MTEDHDRPYDPPTDPDTGEYLYHYESGGALVCYRERSTFGWRTGKVTCPHCGETFHNPKPAGGDGLTANIRVDITDDKVSEVADGVLRSALTDATGPDDATMTKLPVAPFDTVFKELVDELIDRTPAIPEDALGVRLVVDTDAEDVHLWWTTEEQENFNERHE